MILSLMHLVLHGFWHFKALIDWVVFKQSCLRIPVVLPVVPGFFLLFAVMVIVSCNH